MNKNTILFAGPSLHGITNDLDFNKLSIDLHPPVKRHDIKNIVKSKLDTRNIIIADGFFYNALAVSHLEIRKALEEGWNVWGYSSMGAIRACEMRSLGMNGYGYVYEKFVSNPDLSDDEVALLHLPESPYKPLTEPLINIRYYLEVKSQNKQLSKELSHEILNILKGKWYGERTLSLLGALLEKNCKHFKPFTVDLENFSEFRIKNIDLKDFLLSEKWKLD